MQKQGKIYKTNSKTDKIKKEGKNDTTTMILCIYGYCVQNNQQKTTKAVKTKIYKQITL